MLVVGDGESPQQVTGENGAHTQKEGNWEGVGPSLKTSLLENEMSKPMYFPTNLPNDSD
jgi:hypothetical protein